MKASMDLNPTQRKRLHQITMMATFGGLLFGYDTGVINGALRPLREDFGLIASTEGLVMSILLIGAALGGLGGGQMADRYGRRRYMLILSVIFITGAILSVIAPNVEVLLVARFILGFGVGGATVTVPTYIAEVAPHEDRGRLTGVNELIVVFGQILAFVINAVIGIVWGDTEGIWRYMLLMQLFPAIGLLIGMCFAPESPRWLIIRGKNKQALAILMQIRPEDRAIREYKEILNIKEKQDVQSDSEKLFFAGWVKRIVIIGVIWAGLQQTTGINVIMYYGTEILVSAGFSEKVALACNILNGVAAFIGMATGVFFLVDKFSRKGFSIAGFIGMAVILLIIALTDSYLVSEYKPIIIWVLCALFVGVMGSTLGFVTFVVLGEIFPLKIRGASVGICIFSMWITSAVVSYAFPLIKDSFGLGMVFYILSGINLAAVFFTKIFLPETKGKTLEEVEMELSKSSPTDLRQVETKYSN